ncbi:zinc metalloproteinase aureolysin [Tasmannia lanceolata]|uniref:zinc metalloproteinase aureolysin n=1 Tax=Tasmannia lanceolata TaxID=3420 RepID=UPI0040637CC3
MVIPFARFGSSPFHLSKLFRQLEQDMETVIKVLQPGPLGIIEHKFSAAEVREAKATVVRAVENWKRNVALENAGHFMIKAGK